MIENKAEENKNKENIKNTLIEDEIKSSYLDYAMSVIIGRALPDAKDGLKPVHKRILYSMHELGMLHNKPYKKSARVVGEVLGKYHPHGDSAVYDAMARMVQSFSLRYPLLDGQGNFGSIDGDAPAAMRYTEIRMAKLAEEMLADIDKETVDFKPNFDGSLQEPVVLPSRIPNLILNGSSGIAVGMATNIPPHNMVEVCDAAIHLITNPDCSVQDLMRYIKGPDFPTGATIIGKKGIIDAYETGKGKLVIRAKADIEEIKNKKCLVIKEIPYQINKANLLEEIAQAVRDKIVQGINDIRDESDKEGIRVVIELKKDATPEVVLNQLYQHTKLQDYYNVNLVCILDNQPKLMNLKEILQVFLMHRVNVITRRTQYELKKAEERKHILEGLIIAINNIDDVVAKIKKSKNADEAKNCLIRDYNLSEPQAKAILEMKLQKLASLEQQSIKNENEELRQAITRYKEILSDKNKVLEIIKNDFVELKRDYGDKRRTSIEEGYVEDIDIEDTIESQDVVVTISHAGYAKRIALDTYRAQNRGGKGITAAETKEEDFIEDVFVANTHSYILFFTNKGKVYWLKVYEIPEAGRYATGKPLVNLIHLDEDEKINAFVPIKEFDFGYLVMATKNGTIKKIQLSEFSRPRKTGIKAITLDEKDELIGVRWTDGNMQIILATKNGMAARFDEKDVRPMGRTASGVRGIRLKDDEVVSLEIVDEYKTLLTVTENGYGKRSAITEYRFIGRGGVGVINIKTSERNGKVVAVKAVTEEDDVILVTKSGVMIRIPVRTVSVIGRNTQGVRLMKLEPGDKVVSAAKVAYES